MMSLLGLTALLEREICLVLMVYRENLRLIEHLNELSSRFPSRVEVFLHQHRSKSVQIVRTWLSWFWIRELSIKMKSSGAHRVLVLQGDIEQGSEGVLAAKLSGLKTISYIPMVMSGKERSIRLPWLRDVLSRPLYGIADRFIVISSYFEKRLCSLGKAEVCVVFNSIAPEFFNFTSKRSDVRRALGIRKNEFITGFFGRIAYQQKGLDRLLELLRAGKPFFSMNRMLIVGDGPDRDRLQRDLKASGLEGCVILCPWVSDERGGYYEAMDVFVCVSRFEGVPLSILEAIARGVHVMSVPLKPLLGVLPVEFVGHNPEYFCAHTFLGALNVFQDQRYLFCSDLRASFLNKIKPSRFSDDFVHAVVS